MLTHITNQHVADIYNNLDQIGLVGKEPSQGFTRTGYSAEEQRAFELFKQLAREAGFRARTDGIGNMVIERPGTSGKFVETGSHLDTVPFGGNFDGAAGVVAGFLAMKSVSQSTPQLTHGLRLRVWRLEESSTYKSACFGSRAAFGMFSARNSPLENKHKGRTLREALTENKLTPDMVEQSIPSIHQSEVDSIAAHVELHIEQASLLESRQKDIGIVTGIRGVARIKVILRGAFDHSGGTPMGTEYRRDANLALGHILIALDQLASEALAQGHDLVQTVGVINSDESFNSNHRDVYRNAITKVSGFAYFMLDVRTLEDSFKSEHILRVHRAIVSIARKYGIDAEIEPIERSKAIPLLTPAITDLIEESANDLDYSSLRLPSGSYHDAAIVAQQTQSSGAPVNTGMVFIPCRRGVSHDPEEFATAEAIAKGANTLARTFNSILSK